MQLTDRTKDFIRGAYNTILDASNEKSQLLKALNLIFKDMYISGLTDRVIKASISKGQPQFKHSMSVSSFRSGLLFEVQNDERLNKIEAQSIAYIIFGFPPIIRQLRMMGFDTLIIKGKTTKELIYEISERTNLDSHLPLANTQSNVNSNPTYKKTDSITPQNSNGVSKKEPWGILAIIFVIAIVIIIAKSSESNPSIQPTSVDTTFHTDTATKTGTEKHAILPISNTHKAALRPRSGLIIWQGYFGNGNYEGNCTVTITNDLLNDAVVCILNNIDDTHVRNFYLRAGQVIKVKKLPAGEYYLQLCFGKHWSDTIPNTLSCLGNFTNPHYRSSKYFFKPLILDELTSHKVHLSRFSDTIYNVEERAFFN